MGALGAPLITLRLKKGHLQVPVRVCQRAGGRKKWPPWRVYFLVTRAATPTHADTRGLFAPAVVLQREVHHSLVVHDLGSGRIVVSEIKAPNVLASMVCSG